MTELRVEGQREGLIEGIIAIANRFGIVTPYTAYLAEEPDFVFNEPAAMEAMADDAAAPPSGRAAVDAAEAVAELEAGVTEHSTPDAARLVGTRTYYLTSHLDMDTWIEEGFDRFGPEPHALQLDAARLAQLRHSDPHLVSAAALGLRVIARGAEGWVLLAWPDVTAATASGDRPASAGAPEAGPAEAVSDHVIQAGDYLSKVAARCYGAGGRWREIWEANRDRVMGDGRTFSNPDLIHVGWTLRIPGGCR